MLLCISVKRYLFILTWFQWRGTASLKVRMWKGEGLNLERAPSLPPHVKLLSTDPPSPLPPSKGGRGGWWSNNPELCSCPDGMIWENNERVFLFRESQFASRKHYYCHNLTSLNSWNGTTLAWALWSSLSCNTDYQKTFYQICKIFSLGLSTFSLAVRVCTCQKNEMFHLYIWPQLMATKVTVYRQWK